MKKKNIMIIFLTLIGMLFLFFSNTSKAQAEEKNYVIATDLTFAPFEFENSDGEYVGIDIDLLKAIAKDQNFTVEINPVGFDFAVQSLETGQVDGVIAGMSITKEREKKFDFSTPYFDSGIVMVVNENNKDITSYEDLKGKTVGAKMGTESATFLEENQKKYGYSIKTYETAQVMYDVLQSNNIDAAFDDYPVVGYAISEGAKIKMVTDYERGSSYGFAVKKGQNSELLNKFNQGLKNIKASGEYDKILNKYISGGIIDNSEMQKIEPKKDKYIIGTDITFAPFEFAESDGTYVGIDIDLLNRIAELQGFNIEIQPVGFDFAVQSVEASQLDGMIAGMTITEERKKKFDFSEPYFDSGIQLVVDKDTDSIYSYEDLKGKTVGAKIGTESAEFLEKNQKKYGYTIKTYDNAATMYDVLSSGNIDAAMDDFPVIGYAIKTGSPIKTVTEPEKGGSYGFAVKKGTHPELIEMFNEGLKELKRTGEYDKIIASYIDSNPKDTKDSVDESSFIGLLKNNYQSLLKGLGYTLYLSVVSMLIAFVIGIFFGLLSVTPSKILRGISTIYVDIIRGIPLFVLASFIYLGVPNVTGSKMNLTFACIVTLSLNAGAYIAEIVRGGISAVPIGQTEAARSLGLSYTKTMQKIILPQAVKLMIPSFINQFVITLKDTTILSALGMIELMRSAQIVIARTYESFKMYLIIAIIYIIVITALTKLAKKLEKKVKQNV